MCGMTHSYVQHIPKCLFLERPARVYETHRHLRDMSTRCLIDTCGTLQKLSCVWHDSFIYVTWHIQIRDMTHSYTRHDTFRNVTWLIHRCDMTRAYHDVSWLIRMFEMSHTHVRDAFKRIVHVTWLMHICVKTHLHSCDMTHSYILHDVFIYATRLVHRHVTWLIHVFETWLIHPGNRCRVPRMRLQLSVWRLHSKRNALFQLHPRLVSITPDVAQSTSERNIRCVEDPIIGPYGIWSIAIKRPRTRSIAARQVSNAHERDLVTNQNV